MPTDQAQALDSLVREAMDVKLSEIAALINPGNQAVLQAILDRTGVIVSVVNSTAVALAVGAEFTGTPENVTKFQEITVNLAGAPSAAPATVFFEFSPDGTNWDVSVPFAITGPVGFVPLALRVVLPFFRVRYANGSTPMTALRLTTVYHLFGAKHLTRFLSQSIDENEPVENVRAFIGGKSPNGPFINLPASGPHGANSSETPLGIAATFTGAFIDLSQFSGMTVSVETNVSGTLMIEHSSDGVTVASTSSLAVTGGVSFFVGVIPLNRYARVKYTNGGVAQISFRLSTIARVYSINPRFEPISTSLDSSSVAQLVRSVLTGRDITDGLFKNVGLEGDRLRVVAPPPVTPPGTTPVKMGGLTTISANATIDVLRTITNLKKFTIQRLTAGANDGGQGKNVRIEIFEDPNGDLSVLNRVSGGTVYLNIDNIQNEISETFIGNGTRRILLRTVQQGSASMETFREIVGFEENI